jgi:uncharacterized membrane protein YeaQ/YmgE (transglycosylase-associated protein family)
MLLNIIIWILLGAMAGWIAHTLMKDESQMGLVASIIVGIAGASIGGFLMNLYGAGDMTGLTRYGLLMAILGAGSLLFLVNTARRAA